MDSSTAIDGHTGHTGPTGQPDALARYVNVLENVFVAIRGRGVQWSADDRARVQRWHGLGVPLPTVVSAIEERARAYRFMHGDAGHMPIGLRAYERAVVGRSAARLPRLRARNDGAGIAVRYDDAPDGEKEEETPEDTLVALLHELPRLVDKTDDRAISEAYRRAGRSLERSLRGDTKATAEGIDAQGLIDAIGRANKVLRKTALTGVGSHAAAAIEVDVDKRLDAEPAMSRAARTRRHDKLLDRELSARFSVRFATLSGWRKRG